MMETNFLLYLIFIALIFIATQLVKLRRAIGTACKIRLRLNDINNLDLKELFSLSRQGREAD